MHPASTPLHLQVSSLAGAADAAGCADGLFGVSSLGYKRQRPGSPEGLGGLALAPDDSYALIADTYCYSVRVLTIATGELATLAGAARNDSRVGAASVRTGVDGVGTHAELMEPRGIAIDAAGEVAYVSDAALGTVRAIDLATGEVTTVAGSAASSGSADGVGTAAKFASPLALARYPSGVGMDQVKGGASRCNHSMA